MPSFVCESNIESYIELKGLGLSEGEGNGNTYISQDNHLEDPSKA
jgi:hypothetical protein